jgi:hypothetical protein
MHSNAHVGTGLILTHRVLDQVLLGTGLNQIIAGLALLGCTMYSDIKPGDPHVALARSLSAASSFRQLAVPFVARVHDTFPIRWEEAPSTIRSDVVL